MNNLNLSLSEYAKNHDLKIKNINNTLYVTSICDEWFIEKRGYIFHLYHMNKVKTSGTYHKQKQVFYSEFSALRYINEHDNCVLYYKN